MEMRIPFCLCFTSFAWRIRQINSGSSELDDLRSLVFEFEKPNNRLPFVYNWEAWRRSESALLTYNSAVKRELLERLKRASRLNTQSVKKGLGRPWVQP